MAKFKDDLNLVEKTIEEQKHLNSLSIDKIKEIAPKAEETEPVVMMTKKQLAAQEGVAYVEPLRRMNAFGKLPEKLQAERNRDWEYVKGIFENPTLEPIRFWHSKYAGDPDCLWEIPCNQPIYVPRMIAKHLEETMQYHKFDYTPKAATKLRVDDYQEEFTPTATLYRGKFRSVGAFA